METQGNVASKTDVSIIGLLQYHPIFYPPDVNEPAALTELLKHLDLETTLEDRPQHQPLSTFDVSRISHSSFHAGSLFGKNVDPPIDLASERRLSGVSRQATAAIPVLVTHQNGLLFVYFNPVVSSSTVKGHGSTLRVISLFECKKALASGPSMSAISAIQTVPYTELIIPSLRFTATRLALNATSKLLCIHGLTDVVVVILPLSLKPSSFNNGMRGSWTETIPKIECKLHQVGSRCVLDSDFVRKVQWHPLSYGHWHLVVLHQDGIINCYDVANNPVTPESTMDIFNTTMNEDLSFTPGFPLRQNDAALVIQKAVSFTFSANSQDWDLLCLYVLTDSGQMYTICPYLPSNFTMDKEYLARLYAQNETELEMSIDGSDDHSATVLAPSLHSNARKAFLWRKKWLTQIAEQIASMSSDEMKSSDVKLSHPPLYSPPASIGPFSFDLSANDNRGFAKDISILVHDGTSFVVTVSTGSMSVGVLEMSVGPVWDIDMDMSNLHIVELAQFSFETAMISPYFISGIECVLLCHERGLHLLAFSQQQPGRDDYEHQPFSLRNLINLAGRKMVSSGEHVSQISCCLIDEPILGRQALLVTGSELFCRKIPFHAAVYHWHKSSGNDGMLYSPLYANKLTLEKLDIPSGASLLVPSPKSVSKSTLAQTKYPKFVCEEGIQVLTQAISQYRNVIYKLLQNQQAASARVLLQQRELAHQKAFVEDAKARHHDCTSFVKTLPSRLCQAKDKSSILAEKLDLVLQIFLDRESQLSVAEIEWYQELLCIHKALKKDIVPKLGKLNEVLAVAGGASSKTSARLVDRWSVEFGSHQERALSSALMEEHALIANVAGKVELLSQVVMDGKAA